MAEYIVTGCAGFIGSNVSRMLLEEGHQVVGIDNLNDAYDPRIKTWRLQQLCGRQGFQFHRCDIADTGAVNALGEQLGEIEAVFNLAARAGVRQSILTPHVYLDANVTGTLNMLELCRAKSIRSFVLASSSSVYGDGNPMPYREESNTDSPLSPYAASKKAAEVLASTYARLYGIDIAALRFFTVYGPAGRPDMMAFRFLQWITEGRPVFVNGDGGQRRDFTYIDDIARGTIAAGRSVKGFEIINLGSDRPVKVIDAIRTIEQETGEKADIRFGEEHKADVAATWADPSKAKRVLGWEPRVRFEEGIRNLAAWYRENRSWAKEIVTRD